MAKPWKSKPPWPNGLGKSSEHKRCNRCSPRPPFLTGKGGLDLRPRWYSSPETTLTGGNNHSIIVRIRRGWHIDNKDDLRQPFLKLQSPISISDRFERSSERGASSASYWYCWQFFFLFCRVPRRWQSGTGKPFRRSSSSRMVFHPKGSPRGAGLPSTWVLC